MNIDVIVELIMTEDWDDMETFVEALFKTDTGVNYL